jgi:xylose isomerase
MKSKYFPELENPITYESPDSKNPLSFKYYNRDQIIGDKTMAEHLRFAVAYWHTFIGDGQDMFGGSAFERPWQQFKDPMDRAKATLEAAFDFFQLLDVGYYCFHDRDIAPAGSTYSESCRNLQEITQVAKELQKETGIKLLWGTANLFGNPIYTQGAATNPDAHVFTHAAAQVKNAIDATFELGGENYVFWGGREGYESLLNTNLKQEQEQLARFLHMAVDYKNSIGFKGQFLIEPKPCEPMKHQYDTDAAATLSFLREYDLIDHFKLNIEANHATLAGHSFEHELMVASAAGKLGSVDANRGDLLLGWDTDQFPTELHSTVMAMMIILKQKGLGSGGLNFDAKPRRSSIDTVDLFHAHIGGMDTFAHGLIIAHRIMQDEFFDRFIAERYDSLHSGIGKKIMDGNFTFINAADWIIENGVPTLKSARQEMLENKYNSYLFNQKKHLKI